MPESHGCLEGNVLAFDFGLARIGAAIGNTLTGGSRPLEIFSSRTNGQKWGRVQSLIREWEPCALVVGIPLRADGSWQEMTERAERFARQLEGRFHLPVFRVDERFSSVEVEEGMKKIDDAAAAVILEQWFAERQEADGCGM